MPATQTVSVLGKDVVVWKNPTQATFFKLLEREVTLRGSISEAGDLYVYTAFNAIHSTVEEQLAIAVRHRMMMRTNRVTFEYDVDDAEIRNEQCLKRAYGQYDFDICNDAVIDECDWYCEP